ncbi:MAG: lipoyl(octanoyl) transferase LipB [Polyangiales bacterium]
MARAAAFVHDSGVTRALQVCWLGRVPYGPTHELQQRLQQARIAGDIGDVMLLLEHPPVLTLGRAARQEHVLLSPEMLRARGFEVHEIGRGGDVTYHGPGQLVGYPIIDLTPDRKDVRKYVAALEETMIRLCADHGLEASRVNGLNGTWIENRKIGAVGVRISRWVTMHGFAFNVTTDLSHFDAIVPCGIQDKGVTSLAAETGRELTVREVGEAAAKHFAALFDATITWHAGPPELPDLSEGARPQP